MCSSGSFFIKSSFAAIVVLLSLSPPTMSGTDRMVWPVAPDQPRVELLGEIRCEQLTPKTGFLGKLARIVGGRSEDEELSLPFDVLVSEGRLYAVCQNLAALVEIDLGSNDFKLHTPVDHPFVYPVSLCNGGDGTLYIADPEARAVYRMRDGKIRRFISDGLVRPTGVAALPEKNRLYVVDTGDHTLKIFSSDGRFIKSVPGEGDSVSLHYPTFATATADGCVVLNDALNYRIKRFDADGNLLGSFGQEGDGPGTFARPKGISVDSDGHVYVVDNLFDNIQVFDPDGQLMLVIGAAGQGTGQFWSPAGIDIAGDTIYVADTHNNRIQILHYLGSQ